ncbi:NifB/NifX family molybdenum-iron cluster-binding protein [Kosmotoga olearia]|uniref:Dinitrogenase iron-molybdenum cofactor biosynthesis protein n=1 Tax=Kosmotoga olearia (strain ATCC BAA-1733 / DSM 21960 / TBF 19.5.1) TaxID=521045 RepID=C5CI50_KOSOT|nr:NifB/NifX family molybdenum-iron cluster-binding protein [Kosmotoga olearia]ACR79829.1 Dinitrogenase iron-molybdenum cofactor biosynthesis protein [Kosmotoga olearia TBF 19.5.1]
MIIAVPVMNDACLEAKISEHFGHAPYFAFVKVEDNKISSVEIEPNPFEDHGPGEIPEYIYRKGAKVLIARGMGARAKAFFSSFGVEVLTGASGSLKEIIDGYLEGQLKSVNYEPDKKFHNH